MPEPSVAAILDYAKAKTEDGSLVEVLETFRTSTDSEHRKWWAQVVASYGVGLPGKRAELGEKSGAQVLENAVNEMHERRARNEQKARGLLHLPLEEVEALLAAEDEHDQMELMASLRGAFREERQKLENLRKDSPAPADAPRPLNSAPSGSLPALPPAPSPLEPEIASPEPAAPIGPDTWPRPTLRLAIFRPERK